MKIVAKSFPGVLAILLLTGYSVAAEKPQPGHSEATEKAVRRIQQELPGLLPQAVVPGATVALIEGRSFLQEAIIEEPFYLSIRMGSRQKDAITPVFDELAVAINVFQPEVISIPFLGRYRGRRQQDVRIDHKSARSMPVLILKEKNATLPDGGYEVRDLGGRRPVRVNGRIVSRSRLRDRDRVEIGGSSLLFFEEEPAAAAGLTRWG